MTAWCERKSEGDEYSGSEMTRYRGRRKPLSLSSCHHSAFEQLHAYRERCPWLCRRIKAKKKEKLSPCLPEKKERKRKGKEIEAATDEEYLRPRPTSYLDRRYSSRSKQPPNDQGRKSRIKCSRFTRNDGYPRFSFSI